MTSRDIQKPITFYLDESTYNWLTQEAQDRHLSRSAYLRNIVDSWKQDQPSGQGNGHRATAKLGGGRQAGASNRGFGGACCVEVSYPRT